MQTSNKSIPRYAQGVRRKVQVLLSIGMFLWFPFAVLKEALLKAGTLNTKDLSPFTGSEAGSMMEYALNVWSWDVMLFLLVALGAACFVALLLVVVSQRLKRNAEKT